MKRNIFILLMFFSQLLFSQNDRLIDSLKTLLQTQKEDTNRVLTLYQLAWKIKLTDVEQAHKYAAETISLSEKISWQKGIAYGNHAQGSAYWAEDEYEKSLEFNKKALAIREKLNDKKGMIASYNAVGLLYQDMSDFALAMDYFTKSTAISEKKISIATDKTTSKYAEDVIDYTSALGNIGTLYKEMNDYPKAIATDIKVINMYENLLPQLKKEKSQEQIKTIRRNMGAAYGNLGNVFQTIDDHEQAIIYFKKCYDTFKEMDSKKGMALALQNMGTSYAYIDIDKAFECQKEAIAILEAAGAKMPLANAYSSMSLVFKKKGDFQQGIDYEKKALKIYEEVNNPRGLSGSNGSLANCYIEMKDFKEAKKYADVSYGIAVKYNIIDFLRDNCMHLSEIYEGLGDYKKAFTYHLRFIAIKDSMSTTESEKEIVRQTMNFEFKKKELADSLVVAEEKKVTGLQLQQEKTQRFALYGGLALVALFGAFMFNRFRVTHKQKQIIEVKNKETEQQKHIIESHQKEMIDSINYAKRIQYALLANADILKKNLSEYFVFFKPKDIVSGDFYWATEHNNKFYLAVCDSTGHGVPGAFMSLLNMGFLSEAVKEKNISQPNEIFNYVRLRLIESIGKEDQKDGMDAILICLDKTTNVLQYAAANNEPILIRNNKITELAKDKMPVGQGENQESFTNHTFELKKGDELYLYTDGYADQFGGPNGKKFKYKPLNEMLLNVSSQDLAQQAISIEQRFFSWKGSLEQVDDVCVIGIKI